MHFLESYNDCNVNYLLNVFVFWENSSCDIVPSLLGSMTNLSSDVDARFSRFWHCAAKICLLWFWLKIRPAVFKFFQNKDVFMKIITYRVSTRRTMDVQPRWINLIFSLLYSRTIWDSSCQRGLDKRKFKIKEILSESSAKTL